MAGFGKIYRKSVLKEVSNEPKASVE